MNQPVLHVQMLGGFSMHLDAGPTLSRSSRSSASLLAFLIVHRDRPQTRDLLAGRFWSDLAEDKARRRLSNALWQINKAWREDPVRERIELLTTTSTSVGVNPDVRVVIDSEVFARRLDALEQRLRAKSGAAAVGELTDIVRSYRGDLLAGHYDEWIDLPRKRCRDRYVSSLNRLIQLNIGQSDYDTALRHARTLVDLDHLEEEWHREVMRLSALSGHPAGAERQYEACCRILASELGVDPSAETTELMERIRSDTAGPPPMAGEGGEATVLVGRQEERAALLGRINELVGGKGGIVLIEGEAGVGKSRLVEQVVKGAEWRGAQVLVGEHVETSRLTPFEGLRAALTPATVGLRGEHLTANLRPVWLRQASAVLPELGELVGSAGPEALLPDEERWRATEALAQVVLAQSRPKPTVLVLEDVHWCDEDTMAVLLQLGDRLIDSGVLVCLTYRLVEARRSGAIWNGLAELEAKPGSSRLVVPPLEEPELRQLVAARLGPGRATEPALRQLLAVGGGNPGLTLELLRGPVDVLDEPVEALSGADPAAGPAQLPPKLVELLSRRVEHVTREVRQVLRVVATVAMPVTGRMVAEIMDVEPSEAITALADAVDQGFLNETAAGVVFDSDQLRRAVYALVDGRERVALHRAIVAGLEERPGVGVEQLAHHARLAEEWDDAYRYHIEAAEAAQRVNAFQTTAEHYGQADEAARRGGMDDADRLDELLDYERVLDILGRRAEQGALIDRLSVVDGLDPGRSLEIRQRSAWLLAHNDKALDAARLATEGVEAARAAGLGVGELLTIVGTALIFAGRFREATEPLGEAIGELEQRGRSTVRCRLALGRARIALGELDEAERQLQVAHDEAREQADARHRAEALGSLASLFDSQRKEAVAERSFVAAIELAREIGYRHGEGRSLVNLAGFYVNRSRSGRAVGHLAEAAEVFVSLGNRRGEAFVKHIAATLNHWMLGDDDVAWEQATDAAMVFRAIGDERTEAICLIILASILRRRGRRRQAKRQLAQALAQAVDREDGISEVATHLHLGIVTLELGQLQEAMEHVETARRIERGGADDRFRPALLVTRARILAAEGLMDQAVEVVDEAVGSNRADVELSHLVAYWCAEVLASAGAHQRAAEEVELAHDLLAANLESLSPSDANRALSEVPEHRAMIELRERYFATTASATVPLADAPTGRPLEPSELVDIEWTVSVPADHDLASVAGRRRKRILRLAGEAERQGGLARISDLAEALQVSERTVKRDLAALRSEGLEPKTRGAAQEFS